MTTVPTKRSTHWPKGVLAVCALAVTGWLIFGNSPGGIASEVPDKTDSETVETSLPVSKPKVEANGFSDAKELAGNWVRPDGGYKLIINEIKSDGRLLASYHNPQTINVGSAAWTVEDDKLLLTIELRDANYPGSTYTLLYAEEQDMLVGAYYQAVENKTYRVAFTRAVD